MSSPMRKQFEAVSEELTRSDIPQDRKDQLREVLIRAEEASNGAPDKLQAVSEAIAVWIVFSARRELRHPDETREAIAEAVKEAISAHESDCAVKFKRVADAFAAEAPHQETGDVTKLNWESVAKLAVLKSPVSLGIIAAAFVLKGMGSQLLTFFLGQ